MNKQNRPIDTPIGNASEGVSDTTAANEADGLDKNRGEGNAAPRSQLYGRQKARPLSERQKNLLNELFPKLTLDLSKEPSMGEKNPTWLEIGFGGGEHLAWQAEQNSQVDFIGCEPFINGVAKALMLIDDNDLKNIELHNNDARQVLDWLKPASIDRAFVLYPDPWPKKRHRKRRFLDVENFNRLARVLKPGSELRIATDISDYARHILASYRECGAFTWTAKSPNDWRQRPDDWPTTRYEQKGIREGRKCSYFIFRRN